MEREQSISGNLEQNIPGGTTEDLRTWLVIQIASGTRHHRPYKRHIYEQRAPCLQPRFQVKYMKTTDSPTNAMIPDLSTLNRDVEIIHCMLDML